MKMELVPDNVMLKSCPEESSSESEEEDRNADFWETRVINPNNDVTKIRITWNRENVVPTRVNWNRKDILPTPPKVMVKPVEVKKEVEEKEKQVQDKRQASRKRKADWAYNLNTTLKATLNKIKVEPPPSNTKVEQHPRLTSPLNMGKDRLDAPASSGYHETVS